MNYSYLPKPDLAERLPPGNSFTVVGDGGSSRFDVSYVVRTKRAAVVALSPVAAFALWLGVLAVDPYYPFFGFQIPTPLVAVLIALSSLYQALMMLFGREVIDINPAVLTHRRGPFGVGFPTRYQMDLIWGFGTYEPPDHQLVPDPHPLGGQATLMFQYLDSPSIVLGRGLSPEDAEQIASMVNQRFAIPNYRSLPDLSVDDER